MKRLVIIGAAELGSLIHHWADQSGKYQVVGYYEDRQGITEYNGKPVFGNNSKLTEHYQDGRFDCVVIAIGYNHMPVRKKIFDNLSGKIPFATIIHASAYVDPSSKIGEGCVVFPGCVIDQHVTLGCNVLLNTAVTVAHHSTIGNHCFLAPRVAVAGRVKIEESCFIGIGTIIKDLITVQANCIIGAGSLVLKDTEPNKILFGSPAKVVRNI